MRNRNMDNKMWGNGVGNEVDLACEIPPYFTACHGTHTILMIVSLTTIYGDINWSFNAPAWTPKIK